MRSPKRVKPREMQSSGRPTIRDQGSQPKFKEIKLEDFGGYLERLKEFAKKNILEKDSKEKTLKFIDNLEDLLNKVNSQSQQISYNLTFDDLNKNIKDLENIINDIQFDTKSLQDAKAKIKKALNVLDNLSSFASDPNNTQCEYEFRKIKSLLKKAIIAIIAMCVSVTCATFLLFSPHMPNKEINFAANAFTVITAISGSANRAITATKKIATICYKYNQASKTINYIEDESLKDRKKEFTNALNNNSNQT